MANWGWVAAAGWAGIEIDDFPALKAWEERMYARPALKKGANVPDPYKLKEILADKEKADYHAGEARKWIQAGMKDDAQKSKV